MDLYKNVLMDLPASGLDSLQSVFQTTLRVIFWNVNLALTFLCWNSLMAPRCLQVKSSLLNGRSWCDPDCIPSLLLLLRLYSLLSLMEFLISTPQMEHAFLPSGPLLMLFPLLLEGNFVLLIKSMGSEMILPGLESQLPISWASMVMMRTLVMLVTVSACWGYYKD